MKCKFALLSAVFVCHSARAGDWTREIGDFLQVIVPAMAGGMAIQEGGWSAVTQFVKSFGATEISVQLLKMTIPADRPDLSDKKSFPSGHTAAAFSGATFIHKRYGWRRAVLPYIMASFVGYSRAHARKHNILDVVSGASIAAAWTWIFTDSAFAPAISVNADFSGVSLDFSTRF